MKTLRTIWSRIRWLWQRREVKREIDEELRFHLEQRTAENVAAGMAPEAAASEARKRFGNVQSIREECREKRGVSFGEMTLQDVRFGLRMLRKNPGFAVVAVLTLALGIGGVTAVLSVMNGVFLRLLPYQDPGGMVLFSTSISGKDYVEWKAQSQSFSEMAAYRRHYSHDSANPLADTAQELKDAGGLAVEPSFFRALGIRPLLGRPLSDEEGCFEEKPVIILSHHIWRERFGADPQIVGRNVRLCGQSCRVVGVMPANYRLLPETFDPLREGGTINRRVDYWIPLPLHFRTSGPWDLAYNIVARLKGNVSLAKAQEESDVIVHRQWEQWLAKLNLAANAKYDHVVLQPLPRVLLGPVRTATFWLFGAAGMVLIIACANTVNLLLVRSMNRKGEIAVRSALGGSRLRIIRQMLTENVVLVFLGGALGILLAVWGVDVLVEMAPKKLPGLDQAGVDWRVLAAASGVALFTALIVGLIPAWSASRVNLTQALKDVGTQVTTGLREQRTLGLFVISEIALALMLVMGSGLLLHSYWRVMQVELGFERSHLLALRINSLNLTPTHDRLLERLNSIPGVLAAGSMTSLPLTGQPSDVYLMNRLPSDGSATPPPPANLRTVSLDSFGILGIRLKQGRFFTKADTEKAPRVLIINEALARRLWPGEDPVGRRMSLKFKTVIWGSGDMQYAEGEVVGVIRDVKYDGPETGAPLEAYLPFAQRFREHYLTSLVLRCAVAPGALANSVRKEIEAVDASYQVETVEDVQDLYADATASRRFLMVLLSVFAAVAFGLSVVGIYGVVAFTVSRRMREVGGCILTLFLQ